MSKKYSKIFQVLVLLYEDKRGHVRFAHGNADQDLDYSAMKESAKRTNNS